MELSDNAKKLYALLFTRNFNSETLIAHLETGVFSHDDINAAAKVYVEKLISIIDYDDPQIEAASFGETIPGIESSHLLESIAILLKYGLDPNYSSDEDITESIMWNLHFVFNGYQAADSVNLMLENGGNPNLSFGGLSLIQDVSGDISWFLGGDVESRYIADSFMHFWMVLVGHGVTWPNGNSIVVTYDGFDVAEFRNHRNYYCGFIHVENDKDPINNIAVSFFDNRTNYEVARLE